MTDRRRRHAVVIGAGHNGLVAANLLADAGWSVLVLEEQEHIGGSVYSDRSLHRDYVTDWFSAFYPLGHASPVLQGLDLPAHGLRWSHAPEVLAHVFPDDRAVTLSRDIDRTAASLDDFGVGDGVVWRELVEQFEQIRKPLLDALFTPFPPVRPALSLARTLGTADLLRFVRFATLPARRAGQELFTGAGGPILLAGNALHTDLPPEAAAGALYGWLLAMLGQTDGFPVPVGGSGELTQSLGRRLRASGGEVRTGVRVAGIEVVDGRATGVRTSDGELIESTAVLADVSAPSLYTDLVSSQHLPARLLRDLENFQWDTPTLKVDWALSAPVPWTAAAARGAGTVHIGVDLDGLTRYSADLATGRHPSRPFLLVGQMTTSDPTRSPAGTESVWAYTHLPESRPPSAAQLARQVRRVEEVIERHAPGFTDTVVARRVQGPADLHAADANLVQGAVSGGTAAIHQQLFFRPVPGIGRSETPVDGLYLASAAAHPGGGVHGGPGANAARATIARTGLGGAVRRRVVDAAFSSVYR